MPFSVLVWLTLVSALAWGAEASAQPSSDWQLLGKGYQLTADSTAAKDGSLYFTDARRNRIYKIDPDGKIAIWKEHSGGAHGIMAGVDGRLFASQHARKRIVAFSPDGKETVLAEDVQTHHLTVTVRNEIYFTDPPNHRVWFMDATGHKRVVLERLDSPRGVRISHDQSRLMVNDPSTKLVFSFRIEPDGSLSDEGRWTLKTPDDTAGSDAGGMVFDTDGFLYVATSLGVQICDPAARFVALVKGPENTGLASVLFGGSDMQWLYVTDGDRIWRRHTARKGATLWTQ